MSKNNNITEAENETNVTIEKSYVNSIIGMISRNEKAPTPETILERKKKKLVRANDKIWIYKNGTLL